MTATSLKEFVWSVVRVDIVILTGQKGLASSATIFGSWSSLRFLFVVSIARFFTYPDLGVQLYQASCFTAIVPFLSSKLSPN